MGVLDKDSDNSVGQDLKFFADLNAKKWLFYIIFALAAGGGGHSLISLVFPPRPDPFTGADGKELERRLDAIESDKMLIEYKVWELERKYTKLLEACKKALKTDCE